MTTIHLHDFCNTVVFAESKLEKAVVKIAAHMAKYGTCKPRTQKGFDSFYHAFRKK